MLQNLAKADEVLANLQPGTPSTWHEEHRQRVRDHLAYAEKVLVVKTRAYIAERNEALEEIDKTGMAVPEQVRAAAPCQRRRWASVGL